MIIEGGNKALDELIAFCRQAEWLGTIEAIAAEHYAWLPEDMSPEDFADTLSDEIHFNLTWVAIEDFLSRPADDPEDGPVERFLEKHGNAITDGARQYLEELGSSVMSAYEVIDIAPGETLLLADRVLETPPVPVVDDGLSGLLNRGDFLACRVVGVDGIGHVTRGALPFTPEDGRSLIRSLEEAGGAILGELREQHGAEVDDLTPGMVALMDGPCLFSQGFTMTILDEVARKQAKSA